MSHQGDGTSPSLTEQSILLLPEIVGGCYKDGQSATCSQLPPAPTSSFSVWHAGHWRGLTQKSSLHFMTLSSLLALEVISLVQLWSCRAPSVGPSIWILYILFSPHILEELQLGEGDSFWWEVGQPGKTNKTSNWLCHIQPHLGSLGFISSTVQNG